MIAVTEVQNQALLAFDSIAAGYDELFTRSTIGRAQRGVVWDALLDTFEPGAHILELNCGTGEDALFLARHDISVVACDGSEGMIRTARKRKQDEYPDAPIHFKLLPTEKLAKLHPGHLFDGVLSNFSGLNCVAHLDPVVWNIASLVSPRASLLICLSTRFCLAETIWFLLHGNFRRAFRRTPGVAHAKVSGYMVKVHYPTLRQVKESFSPWFRLRSCTGIGVAVPPSYVEPMIRKYPRLLGLLRWIDKRISRLPWLRVMGDHMLLHFERVECSRCY
jgi:ubiquinone/menaquinone biosynthesis C-methylase UbiE